MKTLLGFILMIGIFAFIYWTIPHKSKKEQEIDALVQKTWEAPTQKTLYDWYDENKKDTVHMGDSAIGIFSVKLDTLIKYNQ